jgi:hypothetical protein
MDPLKGGFFVFFPFGSEEYQYVTTAHVAEFSRSTEYKSQEFLRQQRAYFHLIQRKTTPANGIIALTTNCASFKAGHEVVQTKVFVSFYAQTPITGTLWTSEPFNK